MRKSSFALLVPTKGRFATTVLLDLSLFVFALMVLSGHGLFSFNADDLLAWGANYRPNMEGIGALRLVTSLFVHGGLLHLLMNMYGLLVIGSMLEPVLGRSRFVAAYLLSGVAGSVASVMFHEATVSVGASGAIFGLFGVLLVLMLRHDLRVLGLKKAYFTNIVFFVGLNLFIGFVVPGIDNAAHLGGFFMGAFLGLLASSEQRSRERRASLQ
jgi:rhomboid protease GluP